jgi:hypothetical protein
MYNGQAKSQPHLPFVHQHKLPQVSATLKFEDSPGRQWLQANTELLAQCSRFLSIIHPEQWKIGDTAISRLGPVTMRDAHNLPGAIQDWIVPFSGLSVISNQETPLHRDVQGRQNWFDILATFGKYTEGRMELPGIGYQLEYNPGTIVAIAGKTVVHGVGKCNADRVCIVYYMRDKVHKQLGIPAGGWANSSMYSPSQ